MKKSFIKINIIFIVVCIFIISNLTDKYKERDKSGYCEFKYNNVQKNDINNNISNRISIEKIQEKDGIQSDTINIPKIPNANNKDIKINLLK